MCARANPRQRAWQAARRCLGDHRDGELLHTATEGQWPLVPEVPLQGAMAAGTPCRSLLHMQEADGETEAPMGEDLTGGHTEGHWGGEPGQSKEPCPSALDSTDLQGPHAKNTQPAGIQVSTARSPICILRKDLRLC